MGKMFVFAVPKNNAYIIKKDFVTDINIGHKPFNSIIKEYARVFKINNLKNNQIKD